MVIMKEGFVIHHTGFICKELNEKQQLDIAMRIFKEKNTYHYIITRSGTVINGNSIDKIVGHALNQKWGGDEERINRDYIGIALMGDFTKEGWTPQQLLGISYIYNSLIKIKKSKKEVILHKDVSYTSCPGSLSLQIISPFLIYKYKELQTVNNKDCIQQDDKIYLQARVPEKLSIVKYTLWDASLKKIIFYV